MTTGPIIAEIATLVGEPARATMFSAAEIVGFVVKPYKI
jgi:hypothetical protein